jgi:ABC-type transporter Mla MlaB component
MSNSSEAKDGSMPFELQTAADGVKLILAGKLGVQQARDLWDALQPAMAGGHSIRLQADALEEMDTSIVQILCRLSSLNGGMKIGETSDGFLGALERRGLEKFFVQPVASTGPEAQSTDPNSSTSGESREARTCLNGSWQSTIPRPCGNWSR